MVHWKIFSVPQLKVVAWSSGIWVVSGCPNGYTCGFRVPQWWTAICETMCVSQLRTGSSSLNQTFKWPQPHILSATTREILRQKHSGKLLPNSWITKTQINVCCFKSLNFEVICYVAINNTIKKIEYYQMRLFLKDREYHKVICYTFYHFGDGGGISE